MKEYTTKSGLTFQESELKTDKNPYHIGGNTLDPEKITETFAWNEAKRLFELDNMSEAERKKYLEAERRFGERARIEAGE